MFGDDSVPQKGDAADAETVVRGGPDSRGRDAIVVQFVTGWGL
jgi:hypothetical protein